MNFYEELINEIKKLIEQDDQLSALAKINLELSMPYVPNDVDQTLQCFKTEIIHSLNLKTEKPHKIEPEYVFELLGSCDKEQQIIAINYLNKLNLRDNIAKIENILLLREIDSSIKTLILFALSQQEISKNVVVEYNNKKVNFNPCMISFEEDFKFISLIDEQITNSIENENPGIAQDAKLLNINFYLNNLDKFNRENLLEKSAAFILLATSMLDEEKELSYVKKWFNYSEEIVAKILMEIKDNG